MKRINKEHLVSVIVPVFNTRGDYLDSCMRSILRQSYDSLEVIIINDGSNNSTSRQCATYQDIDTRVRVIHMHNQGVSLARNRGLAEASGDFIMFVDSDDMITQDLIQVLLSVIDQSGADIAVGQESNKQSLLDHTKEASHITAMLPSKAIESILYDNTITTGPTTKLFTAKKIKNILFGDSYYFAEDLHFNIRAFLLANKVCVVSNRLYYYRPNPDSVTSSAFTAKRMTGLDALNDILTIAREENDKAIVNAAIYRLFMEALFIGSSVYKYRHDNLEHLSLCNETLRKFCIPVLKNNRVRIDNRLLAATAYIAPILAINIFNIKKNLRRWYNQ